MERDVRDATSRRFWTAELTRRAQLYPDDQVVRLLSRFCGDRAMNRGRSALDVGCGAGRHTALLADFGFAPLGLDYSAEVVEGCRARFAGTALEGAFRVGDFAALDPAVKDLWCVLLWGCAFLRPYTEAVADLRAIRRRLAPDGVAVMNLRTEENWFVGLGTDLGDGAFLLDERAGEYAGAVYLFLGEARARSLAEEAGLEVISFEREDYWKGPSMQRHSWWMLAMRPKREDKERGR